MADRGRFAKGKPKTGGRKKGVQNKSTKALKEITFGALDEAGGQEYLTKVAYADPKTFLSLLGKFVPSEIKAQIDGGRLLKITVVSGIPAGPVGSEADD